MSRSRPGPLVASLVLALLLGSTVSAVAQMGATPMPSAPATAPAQAQPTSAPVHDLASDGPFSLLWWQFLAMPLVASLS
ncbi:hypothetical protein [Luteitalea sp.]|uniref:hypothetical protein n=1 Tax=Luteitalea sp. TaxID=2004800 RepID=UPI0025C5CD06|nr:hypothetical protein [Luteitalea sp.]